MGWFEKQLKEILHISVGQKFEFKVNQYDTEYWQIHAILSDTSLIKYQRKTGFSKDNLYNFIISKKRRKKSINYNDLQGKIRYIFIVKNLAEHAKSNRRIVTAPCEEFGRLLKTGKIKFIYE